MEVNYDRQTDKPTNRPTDVQTIKNISLLKIVNPIPLVGRVAVDLTNFYILKPLAIVYCEVRTLKGNKLSSTPRFRPRKKAGYKKN